MLRVPFHVTPQVRKGILAVVFLVTMPHPASSQQTAYVFNTACFSAPTLDPTNNPEILGHVVLVIRPNAPAGCVTKNFGVSVLGPDSLKMTYTTEYLDQKLTDLKTTIEKLKAEAIDAIRKTVQHNSVKADQVDALVNSIENKLYDSILRRVRADIGVTPSAPKAGAKQ
jgi:hypothetical protein